MSRARAKASTKERKLLLEERQQISEELHSKTAQLLSHALFLLNLYQQKKGGERDIDAASQAIKMAINEVRHEIRKLRGDEPWPLLPSIRDCVAEFKDRARIPVRISVRGKCRPFPLDMRHDLLMLIREALNNVEKHAKATSCQMILKWEPGQVTLVIKDNGIGFAKRPQRGGTLHFGLKFMKERVLERGGELHIKSNNGKGTTLEVVLPFLARK